MKCTSPYGHGHNYTLDVTVPWAALNGLGGNAEVLAGPAGTAASRKLVRSVFYKGMAAAVTESLRAGQAAGCEEWLRGSIAGEIGQAMLDRLLQSRTRGSASE